MKTKAAKLFSDCKYGFIVFIILTVQAIMNMTPFRGVGEYTRLYYLVDYSMGKTSRLLVGSIVNLFTDNPTPEWINRFVVVVVFLMILLVSVLAGKVIKGVEKEIKPQMFVFAIFLVSGSFTFHTFSRFLGIFDVYMFIIALVAAAFLCNKYLRWFVPVLCVAGVFVHQVFVFSYFPLIILISFYLMITQEKKAGNTAVFALSSAVTVAAILFCVLYGRETMTLTFEEMCEIVRQRGSFNYSDTGLENLGFYFYYIPPEEVGLTAEQALQMPVRDLLAGMLNYVYVHYLSAFNGLAAIMSLAVVVFAFFWAIWIKCIKNTDSKGRKFVYICFMLFTLFVPLCCIIAADYIRWVQAGLLTQFGLVFFMFFIKDEPFERTMIQFRDYFKNKKLLLVVFYLVYALAVQRDLTA